MMLQLCEGMTVAHEAKVIHRDLKPANVMLVPEGAKFIVKIVDFGLAKSLDSDAFQNLTQTGEVFGSPLYMSPEQCGGSNVDQRADIYALGCILHYCLVGNPPFQGQTIMETLSKHLREPPPALPKHFEVPAWLESAMRKALAKSADERFQSAHEFMAELKHERVETRRS
jgi:serine/threonine-protein kinase